MAAEVAEAISSGGIDVVNCYCCGLTEECSFAYIARMRERYGRWICGLCAEAVKDQALRFNLCTEEAVKQQMKFRQQFKLSNPPVNATEHLISAMKHVLRRSLDPPHKA
ncbi:uncharacterized protein LOC107420094 [Ziziphus jujuba]|uniref:Uncharacterized protein LOC107420094 n=2 Tax=Ziziphus jujuba TaxID=326968 RepID=A0A6P6G8S7_ZIZJJ|nr:uncharacterized protein LOC107420094 [Ziziphus jujuba]KAH7523891.1 hypothetical protein FEM48_Zijuj06G0060200 [Ziziphus jujuba var. spinosa]